MKLCFATQNEHKAGELRALLGEDRPALVTVVTLRDLGIQEEALEEGQTFADNALSKARFAHERTGLWALSDDSGLCVDALGGAPGVHSACYAGEPRSDARNLAALLAALADVPAERRGARFHCTLCLYGPGTVVLQSGECEGVLDRSARGEHGFGYDPIFMPTLEVLRGIGAPERWGQTLAEIPPVDKNRLSHRGRALRRLLPLLLVLAEREHA